MSKKSQHSARAVLVTTTGLSVGLMVSDLEFYTVVQPNMKPAARSPVIIFVIYGGSPSLKVSMVNPQGSLGDPAE